MINSRILELMLLYAYQSGRGTVLVGRPAGSPLKHNDDRARFAGTSSAMSSLVHEHDT